MSSKNEHLKQFLQGERTVTTPFELTLTSASENAVFHCSEVLRLLPARRLVLRATNNANREVLLKIFTAGQKGEREINKELRGHALAKAAGVNIAELLESYVNDDGYYGIAYDFLTESQSFSDENVRKKQENVAKLLEMTANLHEYGIFQHDIHLDNILLKNNDLYLIDLGSVECEQEGKPLSKAKSLNNLSRLVAQFFPLEQDFIIQTLNVYYQKRSWNWNDSERVHFEGKLKTAWYKRKRDYIKKCFRNCTMTIYGHSFSREYAFRRDFLHTEPLDFINNIEQYMSEGETLKAGNSATVVKVEVEGKQFVIKRYNLKSIGHFLRRCLRKSRAVVSWRNSNLLEFINLPTLKPLGFIENRMGWLRQTSYFISEYHESEELLDVYQHRQPKNDELNKIHNIFELLQKTQVSHGDLKAQNLLIDAQGKVVLIDLDSMREHRSYSQFQKALNKDKKRFLRNWQDVKVKEVFTSLIYSKSKN